MQVEHIRERGGSVCGFVGRSVVLGLCCLKFVHSVWNGVENKNRIILKLEVSDPKVHRSFPELLRHVQVCTTAGVTACGRSEKQNNDVEQ